MNSNPNQNSKKNNKKDKNPSEMDLNAVKDKEREKKLKILDEIDNLRVVENNHFMINKFNDAIKVAEDIIKLAKDANLDFIIEEQEAFIKQVKGEKAEKDKVSVIMDTFESTKRNFDKLLELKEYIKAHRLIIDFKKKFGKSTDLSVLLPIQELFSEEREMWIAFLEEQEKIKQELSNFNNKFLNFLKNRDFESANSVLIKVEPFLKDILEEDLKKKWELNRQQYLEKKENYELCEKVDRTIEESLKLKDQFIFEEALLKVDEMSDVIKNKKLIQCKSQLLETRQEIIAAEIKYNKLYLELAKFKEEFRYNRENDFLYALSRVCEKIIHISQLIGMSEIEKEYENSLEKITNEIEEKESKNRLEQKELLDKAKEIEKYIKIDKDVLPIIEDFSVKESLGDLSENIKEKLEQINTLLLENRVDTKKEVVNRVILKTSSGEVVESIIPREIFRTDDVSKDTIYNVRSGLTNRFEDIIEDAVITDIVPYNFEITGLSLNGEVLKEFPEKTLRKEGIELKWELKTIKPKERIEIKYNLIRRISRTIIFILEDQLKIIKYHSNINNLKPKGLYIAKIPFTNPFGAKLDGIIIEDIIPTSFLRFIEEPTKIIPVKISGFEFGEIFRWDIGIMSQETINFTYKLIDKNQFEEIKSKINELNKDGLENLDKGNILDALDKYKQIHSELLSSIK
ncbi:MAG: hypothetical protein EU532_06825 [Promethearchaeota archaeon]|nr:MAG: hypothetical protein EU532_06825 [Candidatus Lokiarchaeota archaeon]